VSLANTIHHSAFAKKSKKLNEFSALLSTARSKFHLVTVKKQKYYVYQYEGKLNGIENAVVLLSYLEKAFGNPRALRAFLNTDVSLSVDEALSGYACQWSIIPISVLSRQKSISISSNAQKKVMILMHLWS